MRVELVAGENGNGMVLEKFPTLIGQNAHGAPQQSDPSGGQYHCLISWIDDHLEVWNLGCSGGTCVNGARVVQASLKAGDTLRLGGTEFSVRYQPRSQRYLRGLWS